MKVLITTDWYEPVINGVVTSVKNLENELIKKGHEVKIITLSQSTHSYVSGNVTYLSSVKADMIYPNARARVFHGRSKYIKKILDYKPDIVHSQCEFGTFSTARYIAEELNIPIVHTYHTVYEDYTHYFSPSPYIGKKIATGISRYAAMFSDAMIAPTDKIKDILIRNNVSCPIKVIPTGIDTNKFRCAEKKENINGINKGDFVCGYIGRLAKEKNVDELIRLHSEINDPKVKLLIVGDGPERDNLVTLAKSSGISDRVIFTGMIDRKDIAPYYKALDVFVNASESEAQGLTYIEALSCGLPLVCRDDKCLDNVIENKVNGFRYKSLSEYLEIIRTLKDNPLYRKTISEKALISSEKFDLSVFEESVEKLYESCINFHTSRKTYMKIYQSVAFGGRRKINDCGNSRI